MISASGKNTPRKPYGETETFADTVSSADIFDEVEIFEDEAIEGNFSRQGKFAGEAVSVDPVSPANSVSTHVSGGSESSRNIAEYAASVDAMNALPNPVNESAPKDSISDIPEDDSLEVYDVNDDFFCDEILNLAKDFVLRFVTGYEDANEKNLFQYIESKKNTSSHSEEKVHREEAPAAPHVFQSDLANIGYEVINISDMPEEEYRKMFYGDENIRHTEVHHFSEDSSYDEIDSEREHFVDLDVLFGYEPSGKYSRSAKAKKTSEKDYVQIHTLSPAEILKTDDVSDSAKIIVSVPESDSLSISDHFVLQPVDLVEAQRIANEDILYLSEDDLIEELEQIDLTPVDEVVADPGFAISAEKERRISYFNRLNQLSPAEMDEITSDVSSLSALVVEEDIGDIAQELSAMKLVDEKQKASLIPDITDRVVVLDDIVSVDAALSALDEKKKAEMKNLLSYLDGLFEKLPEDVVKRFAESDYFDLYVKVLNDLGV